MFGLPLAFTIPAVLIAFAGLPVLYYLLRVNPPRPRRVHFPPLRLILDLRPHQETPAHTPWWLLLLRLAIAAAIILAMAGPIFNPLPAGENRGGPLLLVIDDGWPAAPTWDVRIAAATQRIAAAGRQGQAVAVVATSDAGREIIASDATHALEHLRAVKPLPYVPDRLALLAPIASFVAAQPKSTLVWIADGIERGHARDFAEKLARLVPGAEIATANQALRALAGPKNDADGLIVRVLRSSTASPAQGIVRALDIKGLSLGEARFDFAGQAAKNEAEAQAKFTLPTDLRNDVARLEILDEHSAGAVSLLDGRWKRRRVGLVSGATADLQLPLLAPNYYLAKALAPFSDIRQARPGTPDPIAALLDEHVNVLVLADIGNLSQNDHDLIKQFVENGGLLLRFAGTRLAAADPDDLVPVRLRRGGRVLGGALSWETPKRLAPFDQQSPFAGLKVPEEVTVRRQVLAEPDADLPGKTWAHLVDGTPLVTASQDGKGMIVLFHVTADTTWSNLPLSGLCVDMLRKIVSLAGETAKTAEGQGQSQKAETVPPTRILDGFGVLGAPPATAKPVPVTFTGVGTAEHPPGFYGPPDEMLAINAMRPDDNLRAADYSGLSFKSEPLREATPVDLRPPLLAIAFVLFMLDALASLWLGGGLRRRMKHAAAALAVVGLLFGLPSGSLRADPKPDHPISQNDLQSALNTRLAYVISGDPSVDEESKNGLTSLSQVLAQRTALIPGDPVGVDPARDELAFYPMLYWPIVAARPQPSAAAIAKIAAYMKQGGTIIFDTRDALSQHQDGPPTPEGQWLRDLLRGVDVPELEPIPSDHVVTKTFYLLDGFVGRYQIGQTWIEALPPPNPADGARPRSEEHT